MKPTGRKKAWRAAQKDEPATTYKGVLAVVARAKQKQAGKEKKALKR